MQSDELLSRVASRRFSRRGFLSAAALAGIGAAGLTLVGCGGDNKEKPVAAQKPAEQKPTEQAPAAQPAAAASKVDVTEADFKITLNPTGVPAGDVNISSKNDGPSSHQLYIARSDLPEDQLPLTADGNQVDEEGQGLKVLGEIETFGAGKTEETTVKLEKARYVLFCNLPGHYKLGMHAVLQVT